MPRPAYDSEAGYSASYEIEVFSSLLQATSNFVAPLSAKDKYLFLTFKCTKMVFPYP